MHNTICKQKDACVYHKVAAVNTVQTGSPLQNRTETDRRRSDQAYMWK